MKYHPKKGKLTFKRKKYSPIGNRIVEVYTDEQGREHELDGTEIPYEEYLKQKSKDENRLDEVQELKDVFKNLKKVKGEKGDKGIDGKDGYNPVKGKDYFTKTEQTEWLKKVTPVKGRDFFTPVEIQDYLKKTTPRKGIHYFTPAEQKQILKEATPLKGKDYFTEDEKNELIRKSTPRKGVHYFDGQPGRDGKDGKPGKDGHSPKHEWRGTSLAFTNPDGSWGKPVDIGKALQGAGHSYIGQVQTSSGDSMPGFLNSKLDVDASLTKAESGDSDKKLTLGINLLDEDDMASDDATKAASQQSIKAYVASQIVAAGSLSGLSDVNLTEEGSPASIPDNDLLAYDLTTGKWINQSASEAGFSSVATSGDHADLSNIGTNTHAQIDSHIADNSIHFSEDSIDHGSISGLSDDDHSQYALLAGRSGGQSLIGGTGSGDDLTLSSTSHGTKGTINLGSALYVDEVNGRVGIGTTGPSELLHIDGTNPKIKIDRVDTTNAGRISFATNGTSKMEIGLVGDSTDNFNIKTAGGSDYFTVQESTGNIGIGTTSPGSLLDIAGNFESAGYWTVQSTDGTLAGYIGDGVNMGGYEKTDLVIRGFDDVAIRTNNGGTDAMFLQQDGNVGIGTTSPDTKLDVAGAITHGELSADPTDPDEGKTVMWTSDGTGSGDDGDVMMKITAGGTTKTVTLVDFSAL